MAKRKKSNTIMKQFTEPKTIKFSKQQMQTLQTLENYNVNISQFIRIAVKEKISRDWKKIKEEKEKIKLPF